MADEPAASIGLSDAIASVRRELETAIAEGLGSSIAFRTGDIEMEFDLSFERVAGKGRAGIKVWVAELGADVAKRRTDSHRLKVTLTPLVRNDGGDVMISRQG